MFRDHQPIIGAWARAEPTHLCRVLQFCIISARQKFFNVPALIEAVETRGGTGGALYGWKARAYAHYASHADAIHWNTMDIWETNRDDRECEDRLLAYLGSLPGLGFTKAGFAVQLAFGLSGCLDSVNLKRLGIGAYVTRSRYGERPLSLATYRARVRAYHDAVHDAGGTERLWDEWCEAIAERYPQVFRDADHVSAFHLQCLNLD